MGSEFGGIQTALSGLLAHKRVMDVIGHNVANANTEGYSRQSVQLQAVNGAAIPGIFAGNRLVGQGVSAGQVQRMRDQFLDTRFHDETAKQSTLSTQSAVLDRIQQALPEPSDTAIGAQLSKFWTSWSDVSNQPQELAGRSALLEQANTLATSLHRAASDLTAAHGDFVSQLNVTVDQANSLASRIAKLNDTINASSAAGFDVQDLSDQRDLLTDQLTKLVGGTARPSTGGMVDIFVGNVAYVRGSESTNLVVNDGPGSTTPAVGFTQQSLSWSNGAGVADVSDGTVAGLMTGVNTTLPGYLDDLNHVASALVTSVNAVHTQGSNLAGTATGLNFFDPAGTTAATVALSADVAGKPSEVAAGKPSGVAGTGTLDGSVAMAIAGLSHQASGADDTYHSVIGSLGVEAQATQSRLGMQDNVVSQVEASRQSVSGVNLDEELANLVSTQHAYSASARVLTAVDELLDTVVNHTGRVGL